MSDARELKTDGVAGETSRGQKDDTYRNEASTLGGRFGNYEVSSNVEGDAANEAFFDPKHGQNGSLTKKPSIEEMEDSEDWDELCPGLYLCNAQQLCRERPVYKGILLRDSGNLQHIVIKLLGKCKKTAKKDAEELEILNKLSDHPHIVKILHSGKCKYGGPKYFMVMEPCLQNLAEYMEDKNNPFNLPKATKFFQQTVSAIDFIHDKNIVHRDLKPSNILVTFDRENIKVSDFGISRQLDADRSKITVTYKGAGTFGFKSPETLLNLEYSKLGLEADIYCLAIYGCYIMTHGGHPFGPDESKWEANIKHNEGLDLSIIPEFPKAHKREQLISLLDCMLQHNRKERPSATEVLDDVFFEDGVYLSDTLFMFPGQSLSYRHNVVAGEIRNGFENRPCVIKFDPDPNQIFKEISALLKLTSHPHIVTPFASDRFTDGMLNISYIVLESCHNLNLGDYVLCNTITPVYDVNRGLKFCEQIINGMKFVHDKLIIHKDLKPSNILLTHDLENVKVADFGSSQEVNSPSSMVPSSNIFGTLGYRPPESLESSHVSLKSDIFSLGVGFYFLLSNGKSPFGSLSDKWDHNTKMGVIDLSLLVVPNPMATQHLIKSMLNPERCRRPSLEKVDEHPCWNGEEKDFQFDYPFEEETDGTVVVERPSSPAEIIQYEPVTKFLKAVDEYETGLKLERVWSGRDAPAVAVVHPTAASDTMKDSTRAIFETSEPGNRRAIGLREWELHNGLDKQMLTNSNADETISDSETAGDVEQSTGNENSDAAVGEPDMSIESEGGEAEGVESKSISETASHTESNESTRLDEGTAAGTGDKHSDANDGNRSDNGNAEEIVGSSSRSDEETAPNPSEPSLPTTESDATVARTGRSDEFSDRCNGKEADQDHKPSRTNPKDDLSKDKQSKPSTEMTHSSSKDDKVRLHYALFSSRSGSLVCAMWIDQSRGEQIEKKFKNRNYETVLIHPTALPTNQSQNIKIELFLPDGQKSSKGHPFHIHGDTLKSLPVSQVVESMYWDEYFLISPPTKNLAREYVTLQFSIYHEERLIKRVPFHLKLCDEEEIKKEEERLREDKKLNINTSVITDSASFVRDSAVHTLGASGSKVNIKKDGVTEIVKNP